MKKVFAVLLSVIIAIFTVACSEEIDSDSSEKKSDKAKSEKDVTAGAEISDDFDVTDEKFPDTDDSLYDDSYIGTELFLEKNKIVTIEDVAEIELIDTVISKDILPSNTDGYYSYYEGDFGKVFVDVQLKYKNLDVKAVNCDDAVDINTAYYRGEYQYDGFVVTEDSDGTGFSSYYGIDPLETVKVHCLIRMPELAEFSDGEIVVVLNIGESSYAVKVRDGKLGKETSVGTDAEFRTNGEIKDNESITIKDKCIFSVEGSEFTKDVLPPETDDFYSHYEADEGKSYLCVRINYVNLSCEAIDIDDAVDAKMKYKNKYEYKCFTAKLDGEHNGFESYGYLYPLCDEYVYCLFEIPQEVADSTDSVKLSVDVGDNTYTYTAR